MLGSNLYLNALLRRASFNAGARIDAEITL
jgi:hypothetical protein